MLRKVFLMCYIGSIQGYNIELGALLQNKYLYGLHNIISFLYMYDYKIEQISKEGNTVSFTMNENIFSKLIYQQDTVNINITGNHNYQDEELVNLVQFFYKLNEDEKEKIRNAFQLKHTIKLRDLIVYHDKYLNIEIKKKRCSL